MQTMLNNRGDEFTILRTTGSQSLIQFTNTGYTRTVFNHNMRKGKCKDYYEPSRYGVGFEGEPKRDVPYFKAAKQLWANMLKRCYTDDPKGYSWKGTTVDKRWHCFANFLEDLPKLSGFDQWLKGGMNLDKDTIVEGNNRYSKEVCCFISEGVNKSLGAKTKVDGYRRTLLKTGR